MEQWLRNLTIGKALIIGLAIAGGYYFMFYNNGALLLAQIHKTQQQITNDRTKIAGINKAIQDARTYKTVKATLGAEMQKVIKAIPTQLTSLDLMQTISNKAKSTGLQINSVAPAGSNLGNSKSKKVFFKPVVISVQLTGTYNQVMQFMSDLTALNKIVTVEDLTMTSKLSDKSSVPIISFTSNLAAYRFLSGKSATKGGH